MQIKYAKCDKCGAICETYNDYRTIGIRFANPGAEKEYPLIKKYGSKQDIPTLIEFDLCTNCWAQFVDDMTDYFFSTE